MVEVDSAFDAVAGPVITTNGSLKAFDPEITTNGILDNSSSDGFLDTSGQHALRVLRDQLGALTFADIGLASDENNSSDVLKELTDISFLASLVKHADIFMFNFFSLFGSARAEEQAEGETADSSCSGSNNHSAQKSEISGAAVENLSNIIVPASANVFIAELKSLTADATKLGGGYLSLIERLERLECCYSKAIGRHLEGNCSAFPQQTAAGIVDRGKKTVDRLASEKQKYPAVSEKHFNWQQFKATLACLREKNNNSTVEALLPILDNPKFRALIVTYDEIARRHQVGPQQDAAPGSGHLGENVRDSQRFIGIRRPQGLEQLGLTVRMDFDQLVIGRITENSAVSKQGLLQVGDTILEVNGKEVKSVEELDNALKTAGEGALIKIRPSPFDLQPVAQAYLKSYFDYDPTADSLIPCKEIGLPFKSGDILEVLNNEEDSWWQARKVNDTSRVGLIPSQALEESRKAQASADKSKSPRKVLAALVPARKKQRVTMYTSKKSMEFDKHDLLVYEEVGRLSPFGRRVLVLIGASGVGRRSLKARLLRYDAGHFATVVPFTSRAMRTDEADGREYNFISRDVMLQEIERGAFLEWGEYKGHYYGTKVDSVRDVVRSGKMCVLDCSPQALKILYGWEFMPFIVFVAPPPLDELKLLYSVPGENANLKRKSDEELAKTCEESAKLEKMFRNYFDLSLVNRNAELAFRKLLDALQTLKTQPQWVPVSWLYG